MYLQCMQGRIQGEGAEMAVIIIIMGTQNLNQRFHVAFHYVLPDSSNCDSYSSGGSFAHTYLIPTIEATYYNHFTTIA